MIRSEDDLRAAARHVSYEVQMLEYAASGLGARYASPPSHLSNEQSNMCLEAFLVHYRNLRDFLCPSLLAKTHKQDIQGCDFFLGRGRNTDTADVSALSSDQERLNRMLAHLSYDREEYIVAGNNVWDIGVMRDSILEQFRQFMFLLPVERQGWFPVTRGWMGSAPTSLVL